MNKTFFSLKLALFLLQASVADYPIDISYRWDYNGFGWNSNYFYVALVDRPVVTSGGLDYTRTFYQISVNGAKVGSSYYPFVQDGSAVSGYSTGDGGFDWINAGFTMNSNAGSMEFRFYQDGRFSIEVLFEDFENHADEVFVRIDYDMMGSSNDLIEEVDWAASTTNPVYRAYATERSTDFDIAGISESGVERKVYARFFEGTAPGSQFFGVLHPWTSDNEVRLYSKLYEEDHGDYDPPTVTSSDTIQNTGEVSDITYAHSGNDQMIWVALLDEDEETGHYSIGGKVFHRPTGRPLRIHFSIMEGTYVPTRDGDLTNLLTSNADPLCDGRTFVDGLEQLVGEGNYSISADTGITDTAGLPGPPFHWCDTTFTIAKWSSAQIHDWMMANRTVTSDLRDDFGNYHIEVGVINREHATLGLPSGLHFDCPGCSGGGTFGGPFGEGIVLLSPSHICGRPDPNATQRLTWMEVVLHEISHVFGMHHSWEKSISGNCKETLECAGCTAGRTPNMLFNEDYTEVWYKMAPESAVKPGKYSTDNFDEATTPPSDFKSPDGTDVNF